MSSAPSQWTGGIIQTLHQENQISVAVAVTDPPLHWGERLRVEAEGLAVEAFFHGSMKTWSIYPRIFGRAAASALAADPGIDAYVEGARTMGGTKVPGYETWLRLRASTGGPCANHPLFQLPTGASVTLSRPNPPAMPVKPQRSACKNERINAVVLASHPHGMVLNVDAPLLRKLQTSADVWYELEAGGRVVPATARRGISFAREEEIWSQSEALLFDLEAHWAFEKVTVMTLSPMQMNWRGKFPEAAEITIPVVQTGTTVTLRPAPGQISRVPIAV